MKKILAVLFTLFIPLFLFAVVLQSSRYTSVERDLADYNKEQSKIIDENKKYTIDDLDYTFIVRAEEESYESTETRNAIRRNVAIYIKNENIDSKISLVMIKHPHEEVKFYFNQDDSFYNFDWAERNLTKLIEFIFYGIEP